MDFSHFVGLKGIALKTLVGMKVVVGPLEAAVQLVGGDIYRPAWRCLLPED